MRLGTASLDADDSQFCSAAVTSEDVRIGWEVGSLRICSLLHASSEMGREKKQQYNIGSTSHQSSRQAWPRICNSSKHFIFVFSTQVSCFNLSLKLSFNLSDFMLFFRNSIGWPGAKVRLSATTVVLLSALISFVRARRFVCPRLQLCCCRH